MGVFVQVPLPAVRVLPTCAVPVIAGATLLTGMPPLAAMTALVAALVAGVLEPVAFVAVTDTVTVLPISPVTGTYDDAIAPEIFVPLPFH